MTKRLDPEIKALHAIVRAIQTLEPAAQKRIARWLYESVWARRVPGDNQ